MNFFSNKQQKKKTVKKLPILQHRFDSKSIKRIFPIPKLNNSRVQLSFEASNKIRNSKRKIEKR